MAQIDTHEGAMHLARAIAGDIALYNEDKVIRGIEKDQLFELLEDELNEGFELYQSRVSSELLETTSYFHQAVVDEVLERKGRKIKSDIW